MATETPCSARSLAKASAAYWGGFWTRGGAEAGVLAALVDHQRVDGGDLAVGDVVGLPARRFGVAGEQAVVVGEGDLAHTPRLERGGGARGQGVQARLLRVVGRPGLGGPASMGSPPPTRTIVPGLVPWTTRVDSRASGPSAARAAVHVMIFVVEAGGDGGVGIGREELLACDGVEDDRAHPSAERIVTQRAGQLLRQSTLSRERSVS
ncbi:hypothetical protein GCM10020001_042820 [Nonomuraea salmonea]